MTPLRSVEEAKTYVLRTSTRHFTADEGRRTLVDYGKYAANASNASERAMWSERAAELEQWLASEAFRDGTYPQGLDELLLDVAEFRATVHALSTVELHHAFFASPFVAQWHTGAFYAVTAKLGKLMSRKQGDKSVIQVWRRVRAFIAADHGCTEAEAKAIDRRLSQIGNASSTAMRLRNTVIAHNAATARGSWTELDRDIEMLARVWAILVGFCSGGVIFPFAANDVLFRVFGELLSPTEVGHLEAERRRYLDRLVTWTRTNLSTGDVEPRSRAFAEFHIEFKQPARAAH